MRPVSLAPSPAVVVVVVALFATPPAAALRPATPQALAASVARGLAFMRRNRDDPSALVVLDYLRRKYRLTGDLAFERLSPRAAPALGPWRRFIEHGTRRTSLEPLSDRPTTEAVIARALHCDQTPVPANFGSLLERYATGGGYEGYEVTHAALALKLLADNGCSLSPADARSVRSSVELGLIDLVRAWSSRRDVVYEALAIGQDLAGIRSLGDDVFSTLVAEQLPDGGWAPRQGSASAPHPTALAIWALLARLRPNADATPFARP